MSICLLDTSILCELLKIPGRCQEAEDFAGRLRLKIEDRETLLLPMSAIVESGNHIGQIGEGRQRWDAAHRFVGLVGQALRGQTPFTLTPSLTTEDLLGWLDEFPEWAKGESGFADLTIRKEFDRQCLLNPLRRVYIWSIDRHLSSYDRKP